MVPFTRNWYPDTRDSANVLIWEEMRIRMNELDMPSLLVHFIHETMRAWYPTGDMADSFFELAAIYETEEEAFDHVTDKVVRAAGATMERWLRARDAETRQSPAMAPTSGMQDRPVSAGETSEPTVDEVEDDTTGESDTAGEVLEEEVTTPEEPEEAYHSEVDPEEVVARMFGPALPPAMLAERTRAGIAIAAHDREVAILIEPQDEVVGPMLVVDGGFHACVASEFVNEHNTQEVALVRCRQDEMLVATGKRKMGGTDGGTFAAMLGATGALRRTPLGRTEPPDRVVLDVGGGAHVVCLSAMAEIAAATGVGRLAGQQPTVGRGTDAPVDRGWLAEFRRRRHKLLERAYRKFRVDDMSRARMRERFAWHRRRCVTAGRGAQFADRDADNPRGTLVDVPTMAELACGDRAALASRPCTVVYADAVEWLVELGGGEGNLLDSVVDHADELPHVRVRYL